MNDFGYGLCFGHDQTLLWMHISIGRFQKAGSVLFHDLMHNFLGQGSSPVNTIAHHQGGKFIHLVNVFDVAGMSLVPRSYFGGDHVGGRRIKLDPDFFTAVAVTRAHGERRVCGERGL